MPVPAIPWDFAANPSVVLRAHALTHWCVKMENVFLSASMILNAMEHHDVWTWSAASCSGWCSAKEARTEDASPAPVRASLRLCVMDGLGSTDGCGSGTQGVQLNR